MAGAWPHLLWSRMPSTRGSYVAGCDGAPSVVRDSIGRVLLGGRRGGSGQGIHANNPNFLAVCPGRDVSVRRDLCASPAGALS